MKNNQIFINTVFGFVCFSASSALFAQSQLPPCDPQAIHRDNCWGEQKLSDGAVYVGEYKTDHREGHGKATLSNGDTYEGDFAGGKYNGQGSYTQKNSGTVFVGTYKDDYRVQGTLTWPNGDKYVGEFQNDKPSKGIKTWATGNQFEGEFKDYHPAGAGGPAAVRHRSRWHGASLAASRRRACLVQRAAALPWPERAAGRWTLGGDWRRHWFSPSAVA